eukprot:gene17001-biopygen11043
MLDFRFTRGFAAGMRLKHVELEAAMSVAEEVGTRLAMYDTAGAGALADGAEAAALPPRMRQALRHCWGIPCREDPLGDSYFPEMQRLVNRRNLPQIQWSRVPLQLRTVRMARCRGNPRGIPLGIASVLRTSIRAPIPFHAAVFKAEMREQIS